MRALGLAVGVNAALLVLPATASAGRKRSAALCTLAGSGLRWRFRGSPRVYDLATGCDGRSVVAPDPAVSEQSPRARRWVRSGHVVVLDDECALAARRGSRRCR